MSLEAPSRSGVESDGAREGVPMKLELATHHVRNVEFAEQTRLIDHELQIDKAELVETILDRSYFQDVHVDILRPRDDARIVHIIDVVEPRVRVSDPSFDFPGLLSPPATVGE